MSTIPYQLSLQAGKITSVDLKNIELYSGQYWRSDIVFEGVADAGSEYIQISTGSELLFLTGLKVRISDGTWTVQLLEDPTLTTGTTEAHQINLNRNYLNSSNSNLFNDATGVSGGTILANYRIFDVGPAITGSSNEDEISWILAPNTNYIIQLTNNSGGSSDVSVTLEYKEHAETS